MERVMVLHSLSIQTSKIMSKTMHAYTDNHIQPLLVQWLGLTENWCIMKQLLKTLMVRTSYTKCKVPWHHRYALHALITSVLR